jgi:hypothetical protein
VSGTRRSRPDTTAFWSTIRWQAEGPPCIPANIALTIRQYGRWCRCSRLRFCLSCPILRRNLLLVPRSLPGALARHSRIICPGIPPSSPYRTTDTFQAQNHSPSQQSPCNVKNKHSCQALSLLHLFFFPLTSNVLSPTCSNSPPLLIRRILSHSILTSLAVRKSQTRAQGT